MSSTGLILTLACPDRRGIVAAVSALLFERGCNILDAQQFDDAETGALLHARGVRIPDGRDRRDLRGSFAAVANTFGMSWSAARPVGAPSA